VTVYSTPFALALWAALSRARVASGEPRQAVEKVGRAERAADRLGGAQRGDAFGRRRRVDQVGEAAAAIPAPLC